MRLLKLLLFVALVAAVTTMWLERDRVVSAYTDESEPIEFRLDGIDLTSAKTPVEPSPFVLVASPDLRTEQVVPVVAAPAEAIDVELGGGEAAFNGTVVGPTGPVGGAVVRLERHTTEGIASVQTTTDALGTWSATGLVGGRWRVRTYVPNLYTSGPSQIFFLANGDEVEVNTTLTAPSEVPVVELVGHASTYINQSYTYAVTVGVPRVDEEGRVVVVPAAGARVSVLSTNSSLTSANVVSADSGGAARFNLTCQSFGTPSMSVSVQIGTTTHSTRLTLAPCVALPPPPPVDGLNVDDVDEAEAPGAEDESTDDAGPGANDGTASDGAGTSGGANDAGDSADPVDEEGTG